MSRILIITSLDLRDPIKGTPIRAFHFVEQIKKNNEIILCSPTPYSDASVEWIPLRGSKFALLLRLRTLIRARRIESVWTPASSMIKFPILLKMMTGVKILIDLHGWPAEEAFYFGNIPLWKKRLEDMFEKWNLRFYDRIFVVSEKFKTRFPQWRDKMITVYGGVSREDFCEPASHGLQAFRIGYAGNPLAYQGLPSLFGAAEHLLKRGGPPFELLLILSGKTEDVEKRIEEHGLKEHVLLYRSVPHTQVKTFLRTCDALIVARPSVKMTEFAFPSKVPEFLATGVPLIVSDVGPIREFLDEKSAIIISHEHVAEELERALQRLFVQPSEERTALGKRGQELARSRLLWDKLGETIRAGFRF